MFKPHKEIIPLTKNRAERDQQDFDYSVRISCCEYYAKEFLELAQKALDVLEFISAPPDELKNSFKFVYSAESKGLELIQELQQLAPREERLKKYLPIVKDLNKKLLYQRKDADQFRKKQLGERCLQLCRCLRVSAGNDSLWEGLQALQQRGRYSEPDAGGPRCATRFACPGCVLRAPLHPGVD